MDTRIRRPVVKSAGFVNGVLVDSVFMKVATANEGGIKEILEHTAGLRVYTTFTTTLVPWSNVAYVEEV